MQNNENKNNLQPLDVLFKLKGLGKKQYYLSRVFKRSEARISQAFKGDAPNLLIKIDKHLTMLQEKQSNSELLSQLNQ